MMKWLLIGGAAYLVYSEYKKVKDKAGYVALGEFGPKTEAQTKEEEEIKSQISADSAGGMKYRYGAQYGNTVPIIPPNPYETPPIIGSRVGSGFNPTPVLA